MELLSGWSIISDARESRAFGNDGEGVGTSARAYGSKGRVSSIFLKSCFVSLEEYCMYKFVLHLLAPVDAF